MVIDFDNSREWFALFDTTLADISTDVDWYKLRRQPPEYYDEAASHLIASVGEDRLSEAMESRFRRSKILAFHGTRLTDDEIRRVNATGLQPLKLIDRRDRYERMFADHPNWPAVRNQLHDAIHELGTMNSAGPREDGRVWACYSRAGLLDCTFTSLGAEIDHHMANRLFNGEEAHYLLRRYGHPCIVKFEVSLPEATRGVTPFAIKEEGRLWDFHKTLLSHWAFSKAHPQHNCATERDATQMGFEMSIGSDRLIEVERL